MRKIHLQALAEQDLLNIWHYTFGQWDEGQADTYLDELDNGIRLLAENSELGVSRDYVRKGYRVLFIRSHAVYYTVTSTTIHIIRVLHGKMDPDRHL